MTNTTPSPENIVLEAKALSRFFSVGRGMFAEKAIVRAVDQVDMVINKGETLGIVGESGCGKSTLGRTLVGLLPPSSGEIFLNGQSLYNTQGEAKLDGSLQMVFQDPFSSLNPRLTIGASIAEPLKVQGLNTQKCKDRVAELLQLVGLREDQATRYPHEFSGGQRQGIAVARALITNP